MSSGVSVIITTYNYARYIAQAIESVLSQTLPASEVVVVDDGSTDDTAAIVGLYLDRGVRYVRQENQGASTARNRGLRETTDELVAFLDADDRWLPDKLALQVEQLRRFPSAGMVTCGYWHVYETRQPARRVRRRVRGEYRAYPEILVENNLGNPSMVLVRRRCFDEVGQFDETLPLGQDWEMWIRIARRFPVVEIDKPLILFLVHQGSLTMGQTEKRRANNELIRKRHISQVRSPLQRAVLSRAAESMSYFYSAAANVDRAGWRWRSLQMSCWAVWLDPFYKGHLKLALLLHTVLGPAAFGRLSRSARAVRRIAAARRRHLQHSPGTVDQFAAGQDLVPLPPREEHA